MEQAHALNNLDRLEDIRVRQVDYWKEINALRRKYPRRYASWREGDKVRHVYVGSVKKMGQAEALQKAKGRGDQA